jgi:type I restriction enzyme R subunit
MGPQKLLTNIISLIRFALGREAVLEPFIDTAEHRFEKWLEHQQSSGRSFSTEQIEWLNLIKKHIAANLAVEMEDFEYAPFSQKGGPLKASQVFGQDLQKILKELSEVLAA